MAEQKTQLSSESILGLSTDQLAGVSVEELEGNPTAIRMVIHYYKKLAEDNAALKNENNTLKTYVIAYDKSKANSAVGAILLALGNLSIGFGVNLLTANTTWPGIASLLAGLSVSAGGYILAFGVGGERSLHLQLVR